MRFIKLFSIMLVMSSACHTTKKINEMPVSTSEKDQQKPTENTNNNTVTWRLVVSFISIGEGTDQQARSKLDSYVEQFGHMIGAEIINTRIPWGREGESDNCFKLENLNPGFQEKFIAGLRELFQENTLVQIAENQPAKMKK